MSKLREDFSSSRDLTILVKNEKSGEEFIFKTLKSAVDFLNQKNKTNIKYLKVYGAIKPIYKNKFGDYKVELIKEDGK